MLHHTTILGGLRNSRQGVLYETKETMVEISRLRGRIAELQVKASELQLLQTELERAIQTLEAAGFDKEPPNE